MDYIAVINLTALVLIQIIVKFIHCKWEKISDKISNFAIIVIIPLNGFLVCDITHKLCNGVIASIASLMIAVIMSMYIGIRIRMP